MLEELSDAVFDSEWCAQRFRKRATEEKVLGKDFNVGAQKPRLRPEPFDTCTFSEKASCGLYL